ncbi:MAG: L-2-hydroxyglutarate oxidase LhgO, partial [Myxococcota bacterium]
MSRPDGANVEHFETECVVIGAGVVGLAIARRIAQSGREVIIVESEDRFGTGTSSRSSEVIHAGLYYAPDSLRAILCVAGKKALYEYCADRGVGHNRCGKLVVATDERELETLEPLIARSRRNGVHDVRLVDAVEARSIEPNVGCVA